MTHNEIVDRSVRAQERLDSEFLGLGGMSKAAIRENLEYVRDNPRQVERNLADLLAYLEAEYAAYVAGATAAGAVMGRDLLPPEDKYTRWIERVRAVAAAL